MNDIRTIGKIVFFIFSIRVGSSESPNGFEVPKRKGVSYTFTKAKTILIEMEGGPLRYVEGALHASY